MPRRSSSGYVLKVQIRYKVSRRSSKRVLKSSKNAVHTKLIAIEKTRIKVYKTYAKKPETLVKRLRKIRRNARAHGVKRIKLELRTYYGRVVDPQRLLVKGKLSKAFKLSLRSPKRIPKAIEDARGVLDGALLYEQEIENRTDTE